MYEVRRPARQTVPVVFASPHSGRDYPAEFIRASRLDPLALRRSEDAFVDELFAAAPGLGAPFLLAHFPRAYVDVNRQAFELDPQMFEGVLPDHVTTRSPRIAAGLGTVARIVASGEEIYADRLSFNEVEARIVRTHVPYHATLRRLLTATQERFGGCLLIDCHSMPSSNGSGFMRRGRALPDIILGDCHGTSCAQSVVLRAETLLRKLGFSTARNRPYAGGYTTRHYGQPGAGLHTLQLEINRGLYLDENRIERAPKMADLKDRLGAFMAALLACPAAKLAPGGAPDGPLAANAAE